METNEKLRAEIFKIIGNQMKNNNPPETNEAYKRLIEEGYDDFRTKQLIGQCLAIELFGIMQNQQEWNEKRYIKNLTQLPNEPME